MIFLSPVATERKISLNLSPSASDSASDSWVCVGCDAVVGGEDASSESPSDISTTLEVVVVVLSSREEVVVEMWGLRRT